MTFFSGTDLSTLRQEGNDRNHFVSLIVNNAGKYTAAITSKLAVTKTINSAFTYKSFEDEEKQGNFFKEISEKVIAYNYLDIEIEGSNNNDFTELDDKIKSIKEAKNKIKAEATTNKGYSNYPKSPSNLYYNTGKNTSLNLFNYNNYNDWDLMESSPIRKVPKETTISDTDIKSIVLQLITGSIAISDTSKIDPYKWSNTMISLFDKRFNKDLKEFELWAQTFVEFLMYNVSSNDEDIPNISVAIHAELDKLPENKYLKILKESLKLWMEL